MYPRLEAGGITVTEPNWQPMEITENIYVLYDKNNSMYMGNNGNDIETASIDFRVTNVWSTDLFWHNTLSFVELIAKMLNSWYTRGYEDANEDMPDCDNCDDRKGDPDYESRFGSR
jgi:hypothetical protein